MGSRRVHHGIVSAGLTGGAALAAAILGMGAAYADDSTDEINGWTVTPTGDSGSGALLTPATLSDPSDSLGLGTDPIVGTWVSGPTTASNTEISESFTTALVQLGAPGGPDLSDNLNIQDGWFDGLGVETANIIAPGGGVNAFLVSSADGSQVVDLFNADFGDAPPLFNPDATGPIDIGGVQLADPQDGALFNDLFDALFKGDTADWANATTLFDDWMGIDPSSGAADAIDPSSLVPDLGF